MTTAQRFYLPIPQIFTDLGTLAPGWKLYFYQTGTTTPLAVYSDVLLTVPLPNPVLTNNDGHLVDGSNNITSIYYADSALYKAILKDENDVEQWTADPCDPYSVSIGTLSPRPMFFAGTTTGTSAAYILASAPPFLSYSATDIFELAFHVSCAANPTLQYGTSLPALNLKKMTIAGTKEALVVGDVSGTHLVRNDGIDVIVLDPKYPYLNGNNITQSAIRILISNNVADANNDIDFAAGTFQFSDGTGFAALPTIIKKVDINWAVGTNQGGLDTGSKAANTWYYCYAIYNPASNIADAIFSINGSTPTLPSGYTKYAKIGIIRTDGSSNIRAFSQNNNVITYKTMIRDRIFAAVPTSPANLTLTCPPSCIDITQVLCISVADNLFLICPTFYADKNVSATNVLT